MIELPESHILVAQIKEHLLGKTVMNVYPGKSPHKFAWFTGDPELYNSKLTGTAISDTNAYGAMVEVMFDDMSFVVGEGTNTRFYVQGEKLPDKYQLHIEFDDFSSLICSVQMYGGMWLMGADGWNDGYFYLAKTRTSPMSEENTEEYFFNLLNSVKQNYSVKAFLATEQRYPGLGNGVLQDILFNAKVHPRRKLETLTQNEKEAIYVSIKQTLWEMTSNGGRDTERDLFGCPGGYKTKLSAKTKNEPCPVCGDDITKEAFVGGNIYFCPTCQKYEKPVKK